MVSLPSSPVCPEDACTVDVCTESDCPGGIWARATPAAASSISPAVLKANILTNSWILKLFITQRFRRMQFCRTIGRQITKQQSRRAVYQKRQHHRDGRDRNVYSRRGRDQPQHAI